MHVGLLGEQLRCYGISAQACKLSRGNAAKFTPPPCGEGRRAPARRGGGPKRCSLT
jgi:hypothetical protein